MLLLKCRPLLNYVGLTFTNEGIIVLGSPIGDENFTQSYCKDKLSKISTMIDNLTAVGKSHPQQAWIVLSRSTKFKSTYLFRTTPSVSEYAMEYNISLKNFISTIIGRQLD